MGLLGKALRFRALSGGGSMPFSFPKFGSLARGALYLVLHAKPVAFEPSALLALRTPSLLVPFVFGPLEGRNSAGADSSCRNLLKDFPYCLRASLVGIIWDLWNWPLFSKGIVKSPAEKNFFLLPTSWD